MTSVNDIIDNMEILFLTAILLLAISFFILFVKYKNKINQALIFLASFSPLSSVRILLYRFLGMNIGKNVSIGCGTYGKLVDWINQNRRDKYYTLFEDTTNTNEYNSEGNLVTRRKLNHTARSRQRKNICAIKTRCIPIQPLIIAQKARSF